MTAHRPGLGFGHVQSLNLLHGHGRAGDFHRAARPIFVILVVPDQLRLLRERMGAVRAPADGFRHGRRPPGEEGRSGMKKRAAKRAYGA